MEDFWGQNITQPGCWWKSAAEVAIITECAQSQALSS